MHLTPVQNLQHSHSHHACSPILLIVIILQILPFLISYYPLSLLTTKKRRRRIHPHSLSISTLSEVNISLSSPLLHLQFASTPNTNSTLNSLSLSLTLSNHSNPSLHLSPYTISSPISLSNCTITSSLIPFTITQSDTLTMSGVTFTGMGEDSLFTIITSNVNIDNCTFIHSSSSLSHSTLDASLEEVDLMCLWSGGILCLSGVTSGTVNSTTINSTESGGIQLHNSNNVTIDNCKFYLIPSISDVYPSIKHNIFCQNSSITVDGVNITSTTSLWIYDDSCTSTVNSSDPPPSTYFIPSISHVSVTLINTTSTPYLFTFVGSNFFPCFMEWNVEYEGSEGSDQISIPFSPSSENHTNVSFPKFIPASVDRVNVTLLFKTTFSSSSLANKTFSNITLPVISSEGYDWVIIASPIGFGSILFLIIVGCVIYRVVMGCKRKKKGSNETDTEEPLVDMDVTNSQGGRRGDQFNLSSVDSTNGGNLMEFSDDQDPAFEGEEGSDG